MSADESIKCGSCRACCRGEVVFLLPEDNPSRYLTRFVSNPLQVGTSLALVHKPNGDCVYLGEGGCTIYAERPHICRTYNCVKAARLMDAKMSFLPSSAQRKLRRQLKGTPYEIGKQKMEAL